ncbi:MAG: YcaO-like family protein [Pseudomonadota bacterium]
MASPPSIAAAASVPSTRKPAAGRAERLLSAEVTFANAQKLFEPLRITRVADVTGLDCIGIPVVTVCRPNARSLALSQGKGPTLAAARASGVMEAIELYHAERISLDLKLGTWNELRFALPIVSVGRLPRIGVSRFTPNTSLLWVQGVDLIAGIGKWLPFELVHINMTLPFPTGTGCFVISSNGLASGNHLLEATIHGLCEVIERDAALLLLSVDQAQQFARQVDLATVNDAECLRLLGMYERAGIAVAVWDMTSDVGVAAFRCIIMDREANPFRPLPAVEGFGCHLLPEAALSRALTEAAQARLTLITGSRDDNLPHVYQVDEKELDRSRKGILAQGKRSFQTAPRYENETLEADLDTILQNLKRAGLDEAIAVDLTKPAIKIPVVRIVVPGLEPYHGVGGGRGGERARRASEILRASE